MPRHTRFLSRKLASASWSLLALASIPGAAQGHHVIFHAKGPPQPHHHHHHQHHRHHRHRHRFRHRHRHWHRSHHRDHHHHHHHHEHHHHHHHHHHHLLILILLLIIILIICHIRFIIIIIIIFIIIITIIVNIIITIDGEFTTFICFTQSKISILLICNGKPESSNPFSDASLRSPLEIVSWWRSGGLTCPTEKIIFKSLSPFQAFFFSIILCSICLVNKVHSSTWANVRINAALCSYLAVPRHGKRTAWNLAMTPKGLKRKRHRHFPADTEDTSSLPSFSYPASFRHPPPASSYSGSFQIFE